MRLARVVVFLFASSGSGAGSSGTVAAAAAAAASASESDGRRRWRWLEHGHQRRWLPLASRLANERQCGCRVYRPAVLGCCVREKNEIQHEPTAARYNCTGTAVGATGVGKPAEPLNIPVEKDLNPHVQNSRYSQFVPQEHCEAKGLMEREIGATVTPAFAVNIAVIRVI